MKTKEIRLFIGLKCSVINMNYNVGTQIYRYSRGFIDINKLIAELKFEDRAIQYFFGTEKAIKLLRKI